MTEVTIQDMQANLQSVIKQVENGEEILIARDGQPVARLVPYSGPPKYRVAGLDAHLLSTHREPDAAGGAQDSPRVLGLDAGKIWIADDFDDPLPPDLQQYFE